MYMYGWTYDMEQRRGKPRSILGRQLLTIMCLGNSGCGCPRFLPLQQAFVVHSTVSTIEFTKSQQLTATRL